MLCESVSIRYAITKLFYTYNEFGCTKVVGNGALADLLWVRQIVEKLNEVDYGGEEGLWKTPWTYRDEMCFRTFKALFPTVYVEFEGTKHDALDDAVWQSLYMIEVLNKMDGLSKALEKISEWPDGGSDYGQRKIKVFAKSVLEGIGYV